jgi:nitrate reductase gamma subunit
LNLFIQASFVVFRLALLSWMAKWIISNSHLIHVVWFAIGSTGLVIMMAINMFLLKRLIQTDFMSESKSKIK